MPGSDRFSTLSARRFIAAPSALDAVDWPSSHPALRLAPDDLLLVSDAQVAHEAALAVLARDEHAIVEPDAGWSGLWMSRSQFARLVAPRVEWPLPTTGLGQGRILGVPAKVWFEDHMVLVVCATAYVHELADRLGVFA